MNFKKISMLLLVTVLALGTLLTGCSSQETSGNEGNEPVTKTATLSYVAWASEIASTYVVKNVLEDKLGYEIELKQIDAGPMYMSVADGSADGTVAAWLPTTQKSLYEKNKDNLVDLGANLEGTKIGLVVPKYVTIDSIDELNDSMDKFDGKIVGIDAGAGIMDTTNTAIEEYGLNLELQSSSGAAMTAALAEAIKDEKWVVVTGWTPHWKFAKYDLKYLEDPKGVYGDAEEIRTLVRKGLKEDDETLYKFLDNFNWTPADMEQVMVWIKDGMDKDEAADKWINENEDKVSSWLPAE